MMISQIQRRPMTVWSWPCGLLWLRHVLTGHLSLSSSPGNRRNCLTCSRCILYRYIAPCVQLCPIRFTKTLRKSLNHRRCWQNFTNINVPCGFKPWLFDLLHLQLTSSSPRIAASHRICKFCVMCLLFTYQFDPWIRNVDPLELKIQNAMAIDFGQILSNSIKYSTTYQNLTMRIPVFFSAKSGFIWCLDTLNPSKSHGFVMIFPWKVALFSLPEVEITATAEDRCRGSWGQLSEATCSDFHGLPGLVNIQKTMENHHRNSGFSHEKWINMVDLSIFIGSIHYFDWAIFYIW